MFNFAFQLVGEGVQCSVSNIALCMTRSKLAAFWRQVPATTAELGFWHSRDNTLKMQRTENWEYIEIDLLRWKLRRIARRQWPSSRENPWRMSEGPKPLWWIWSPCRGAQGYTPLGHILVLIVFILSLVVIFALMWYFVSSAENIVCIKHILMNYSLQPFWSWPWQRDGNINCVHTLL